MKTNSTLIITGMHRSGTSLTASLLQSAGLNIGHNFLPANHGNIKGYFENLDFLSFHRAFLKSKHLDENGWTLKEITDIEKCYQEQAKAIVEKNSVSPCWGWKDPRTTLFLNFWAELLPEAKFLFIYRSPLEVIESLYRRNSDPIFINNQELVFKLWNHYNQKILDFSRKESHRCLLTNIHNIVANETAYLDQIKQKFNLPITNSVSSIYDPSLLSNISNKTYTSKLCHEQYIAAMKLYEQLEKNSWIPKVNNDFNNYNNHSILSFRSIKFNLKKIRSWLGNFSTKSSEIIVSDRVDEVPEVNPIQNKKNMQELPNQTKLETSKVQQKQVQIIRDNPSKSILNQNQTQELEETKSLLKQTELVLEQSQSQLYQTEVLLDKTIKKLQDSRKEAEEFQSQLNQMKEELECLRTENNWRELQIKAWINTAEEMYNKVH